MKRAVTVLLLPLTLLSQPEFFGYFESEGAIMNVGAENYTYGFNKLRLDVEARPNDNVLIGANVNFEKYWGKTVWNAYDFIPGYQDLGLVYNVSLPDTILLDNMYMKVNFQFLDLTVGRQQISPGVGYAWNPTDIFNTKSLMDPSYEQTGVRAIRVEIPLGGRFALDAVIDPAEDLDRSTKQIWAKTGFGRFDFDITAAQYMWESARSFTYGMGPEDERILFGASLVGELFDWGLWTEFASNELEHADTSGLWLTPLPANETKSFNEYVIGVDHTFDNSLYLLIEYLHNEYGIGAKSDLGIFDYMHTLSGGTHSLMQDYSFIYIMHPTFDFVSLSAIVFANLNDKSGVISPMLDWNIFEDTNVSVQGSYAWGEDDTEFGLQDWGVILNITNNF